MKLTLHLSKISAPSVKMSNKWSAPIDKIIFLDFKVSVLWILEFSSATIEKSKSTFRAFGLLYIICWVSSKQNVLYIWNNKVLYSFKGIIPKAYLGISRLIGKLKDVLLWRLRHENDLLNTRPCYFFDHVNWKKQGFTFLYV